MSNLVYMRRVSNKRFQIIQRARYNGAPPNNPRWVVNEYRLDNQYDDTVQEVGAGIWHHHHSYLTSFVDRTDDASHRQTWAYNAWTENGAGFANDANNNYPQTRTSGALVVAPAYYATEGYSFITAPGSTWDAGTGGGYATFSGGGGTYKVLWALSSKTLVVQGDASGEGTGKTVTYAGDDKLYAGVTSNQFRSCNTSGSYWSKTFTVAAGKEAIVTVMIAPSNNARWDSSTTAVAGIGEFTLTNTDTGDQVQCYGRIARMFGDANTSAWRHTSVAGPYAVGSTLPKVSAFHNIQHSGSTTKGWYEVEVARHLPPGNYELRVYSRSSAANKTINVGRGTVLYMSDPEPTDANVDEYDQEYRDTYLSINDPGTYCLKDHAATNEYFNYSTANDAFGGGSTTFLFGPGYGFTRQSATHVTYTDTAGNTQPVSNSIDNIMAAIGGNNQFHIGIEGSATYGKTQVAVSLTTQSHELTNATQTAGAGAATALTSDGGTPTILTAMGDTTGLAANDLIEIYQLKVTDAASAFDVVVTSVTGGFTADMVGKIARIQGGALTHGDYKIMKYVDANTIWVDRPPGNGGGSTLRVLHQNPAAGWGGPFFQIASVDSGTQVTLAAGHVCPAGSSLDWAAATWKHRCTVDSQYTCNGQWEDETLSVAWQNSKTITAYVAMISPNAPWKGNANRPQRTRITDETGPVVLLEYPFDCTRLQFQDKNGNDILNAKVADVPNQFNLDAYRKIAHFENVDGCGFRSRGRILVCETNPALYTGSQDYATANKKSFVNLGNLPKVYTQVANALVVGNTDVWTFNARRYWAEQQFFANQGGGSRSVAVNAADPGVSIN